MTPTTGSAGRRALRPGSSPSPLQPSSHRDLVGGPADTRHLFDPTVAAGAEGGGGGGGAGVAVHLPVDLQDLSGWDTTAARDVSHPGTGETRHGGGGGGLRQEMRDDGENQERKHATVGRRYMQQ